MSISFKQVIIHTLDQSLGQAVISKNPLVMTDEQESFITKKLISVMDSTLLSEAIFKDQQCLFDDGTFCSIVNNWNDDKFEKFAEMAANIWFKYKCEYGTIKDGDLIISNYNVDGTNYLGVIKVNFKNEKTHYYVNGECVKIIDHKTIYENKIDEAAIIDLDKKSISLLDKTKSKYLALLFDTEEPELSVDETVKSLQRVAAKVIDEHYDNPLNAMTEFKNNVAESISRTSTIDVEKVMQETFGDDKEVFETCIEALEEYGIMDKKVDIIDSKIANKFSIQKLKTDTGIEIKIPTHLTKDSDFFEVIYEPNGTQTLIIKNVSTIINK